MAGGKETPRQKMIGMMYLVLTAMLALNVSRQVLNAFAVVNGGLKLTNKNYDEKNAANYSDFEDAMKKDPARTKKFYDNAMQAKKLSKEMCDYIDTIKSKIISATDSRTRKSADTISLMDVDSKENFDIPTRIMVNTSAAEDGTKGEAHILRGKLDEFRKKMIGLLDQPKDTQSINLGLLAKGGYNANHEYQKWEIFNFEEQPLASAVVTLTRLQNDVKNAETSVVQKLLSSITRNTMVVDKFIPLVYAPNSYILAGDSFRAQIMLTAQQKTKDPVITIDSINGKPVEKEKVSVSGGIGRYDVKTGSEGEQKFAGTIGVQDPEDPTGVKMIHYPFRSSYLVAKPSVVVSPTKMNVFYIGVENPVDISAAGFSNSDLFPSFGGAPGSLTKASGGGYVVKLDPSAKQGTECTISVSGKMPDGSKKSLGQPSKFRIKRVPDPICYFAGKKGDINVTKGELQIATQVQARMENFDFELKYDVTGFKMVLTVNGNTVEETSQSNLLTPKMKDLMGKVGKGTHIIIEGVHVRGPDGSRTIPGANIQVD